MSIILLEYFCRDIWDMYVFSIIILAPGLPLLDIGLPQDYQFLLVGSGLLSSRTRGFKGRPSISLMDVLLYGLHSNTFRAQRLSVLGCTASRLQRTPLVLIIKIYFRYLYKNNKIRNDLIWLTLTLIICITLKCD